MTNTQYADFLSAKRISAAPVGFEVADEAINYAGHAYRLE